MNVPAHCAVAKTAGFGVVIAVPSVTDFRFFEIDPAHRPPFNFESVDLVAFALASP